jgi:hypothetical protein
MEQLQQADSRPSGLKSFVRSVRPLSDPFTGHRWIELHTVKMGHNRTFSPRASADSFTRPIDVELCYS